MDNISDDNSNDTSDDDQLDQLSTQYKKCTITDDFFYYSSETSGQEDGSDTDTDNELVFSDFNENFY